MQNESKESVSRKKIIQEILAGCSATQASNALINLRMNGDLETINAPAAKIINDQFKTHLSPGDSIFSIIPTHNLENFGIQLKSSSSGLFTECQIPSKDSLESVSFLFFPVFDKGHKVKYIQVVINYKEIRVKNKFIIEDNLKELFDTSTIGIFLTKPTGEILDVNIAANLMFDYSIDEFRENGRNVLFDSSDGELMKMLETRKIKGSVKGELTAIKKDGTKFQVQVFSSIYKDSSGEEFANNVLIDISKQRVQEIELAKTTRIFKSLFECHPDPVYSFDLEGNFISLNPSALNLSEGSIEQLTKMNFSVLIPEEELPMVSKHFESASQGETQSYKTGFISLKGSKRRLHITNFPIISHDKITGVFGIARDITEVEKNERALEELNFKLKNRANELAISNAELEQFAYIASHDLQEPLRMVTGFLSQLQKKYEDQLDEKAHQYIHFATDGAVRMRQIILDLLEYSRIGRMNYQYGKIDLSELILGITGLYTTSIEETNAVINYGELPMIEAAKTPLQRVFSNLISNALKYHHKDVAPVIDIKVLEHKRFWEIIIADNGIGIRPQFFDKIFVIFQRLHARDEYSGTGIGLSICKKIVENHGGEIWLTSEEGKGSTFHFTIKR